MSSSFSFSRFLPLLFLLCFGVSGKLFSQIVVVQPDKGPTGVMITGVTLICKGSETMLKAEGDYESFSWNTGSAERIITVKEEGIYEVTVKTKAGCTFTGSVNVQVRVCN